MRIRIAAVFVAALLGLTACSSGTTPGDTPDGDAGAGETPSETTSQSITITAPVDLDSFDPNVVPTGVGNMMKQQVIETLMTPAQEPLLATEWNRLDDDMTWEFKLREGVKFTNGDDFNADTVLWSFERLMSEDNQNSSIASTLNSSIDSVTKVDDHTVAIKTDGIVPDFLDTMINSFMLTPAIDDLPDFGRTVIGTGAYKLKNWSQDEKLELEVNEDYWGEAPHFTEVTFRPVGESSVRATELRSGGADIILEVAPQDFSVVEGDGNTLVDQVSAQSLRIHMNAGEAPFDNVAVRQAMNYGIDRETILATVLEGQGELMSQPSGVTIFGFNPDLEPYPFDPAKAKELMESAGYTPENPAQIELQLQQDRFPGIQAVADVITSQLNEVGFETVANMNAPATFLENFNTQGNGFLVMSQEANVTDLMPSNFSSLDDSYKRYNYSNPEVDALIESAQSEPDDQKRLEIYQELNSVLRDDAPWVFMWNPMDTYGINESITGFEPDGVGFFYVKDLARA